MKPESEKKALAWWETVDRFALLKKYGYQDSKKSWLYKPLTNKGIFMMWCKEKFEVENDKN